MYSEPNVVPEEPIKSIDDTPTPDSGGGDELSQLCQSTHQKRLVERLEPTMWGKTHRNTTVVTPGEVDENDEAMDPIAVKHIFTQLSLKQRLSEWKEKGQDAVMKELSQLHFCNMIEPVDPSTLTKKEKERAIESHLFFKLK